jgi:hypothetical protein
MNFFFRVALSLSLLLPILGCSDTSFGLAGAVTLTGTLSDAGEPLFVEGIENATGMIVVGFHPIVEGKPAEEVTTATVNLEGNFEIPQGIEPGEYLITVRQWEPYPQKDLLKGKFSAKKSEILRTIDGETALDIDISKPEG